jgi:hypothetical protein
MLKVERAFDKIPGMAENPLLSESKDVEQDEQVAGSYERWQNTRIQHQGAVINLILTLTIAAMGFGGNLLFKKEGDTVLLNVATRWLVLGSLAVFVIAVFWGLRVNLSRLWDFRWTARAARLTELRQDYEPQPPRGSTSCGQARDRFPKPPPWVYDLIETDKHETPDEERTGDNDKKRSLWKWFHQGPRHEFQDGGRRESLVSFKNDIKTLLDDSNRERLNKLDNLRRVVYDLPAEVNEQHQPERTPFSHPLQADEQELLQSQIAYGLGIVHDRCALNASRFSNLTSKLFGWQLVTFFAGVLILAMGMLFQLGYSDESGKEQRQKLSSLDRQMGILQQQVTALRQDHGTLSKRIEDVAASVPTSLPKSKRRSSKHRR